jgi:glyceraldehyde 3-phosphate dehydrogenase
MIKVAINGYGRIGRVAHRVILQKHPEIEIVAINAGSSTDLKGWGYLLKYDSNYGPLDHEVSVKSVQEQGESHVADAPQNDKFSVESNFLGYLVVDGKEIPVFSQKDPTFLPWKDLDVDVVIDCTGKLLTKEKAQPHLDNGAKAVVMSAPAKDDTPTYVLSINGDQYKGENIINNASCTTNCIAPVAKIMEDTFGVEKAMMTTIHGYTSDQQLLDGGHKDYRRARAAAINMIPTSTGATKAVGKVIPSLNGIFNGLAIRVPVPVGSLSDFTFLLKKEVTKEEVNEALSKAAEKSEYKGIMRVTTDPIVSSDIVGDSHSSIVDLSLTQVVGGNLVKVIAWYDNEWGYTNRLVEMTEIVGEKISK